MRTDSLQSQNCSSVFSSPGSGQQLEWEEDGLSRLSGISLLGAPCFFGIGTSFYFMCMNVLPPCMYVYQAHAWCPHRSKEGVESCGTGVTDVSEQPVVLEVEPGSSARVASVLDH